MQYTVIELKFVMFPYEYTRLTHRLWYKYGKVVTKRNLPGLPARAIKPFWHLAGTLIESLWALIGERLMPVTLSLSMVRPI